MRQLDRRQTFRYPAADLLGGDPVVLRAEGGILLYTGADNLVIGVLKDHAHLGADLLEQGGIGGGFSVNPHRSGLGQEQAVEMLGKGGFSAAIGA